VEAREGGADEALTLGVRPEHLSPSEQGLRCIAETSEILGAETIVHARLESGEKLVASLRGIHRVTEGEQVAFAVAPQFVHVFDAEGKALAPLRAWVDDHGHRDPQGYRSAAGQSGNHQPAS
jgi:ABC-type sugar transport system ATPase subunit